MRLLIVLSHARRQHAQSASCTIRARATRSARCTRARPPWTGWCRYCHASCLTGIAARASPVIRVARTNPQDVLTASPHCEACREDQLSHHRFTYHDLRIPAAARRTGARAGHYDHLRRDDLLLEGALHQHHRHARPRGLHSGGAARAALSCIASVMDLEVVSAVSCPA